MFVPTMKIIIDEDKCIGCMSCTSVSPEVYEMNEKRKAVVRKEVNIDENEDEAEKGAEICPTNAIKIEK